MTTPRPVQERVGQVELSGLLACPACHGPLGSISVRPGRELLECPRCSIGIPVLDGFPLLTERDVFDGQNAATFLEAIERRCWPTLTDAPHMETEKRRRALVDDYAAFQPFNESARVFLSLVDLLRERLKPGDVILDLWNRTGWTAEWLSGIFPEQTIVSLWEGATGALGYSGFRRWLSFGQRASNTRIVFHDPNEPLPLGDHAVQLVHGYDTLHRYHQPVLLPEVFRICRKDGLLVFPHVHLSNGTPSPFFEREGVLRLGEDYQRILPRLSGPTRAVFVLGERTLFERQGAETVARLESEPATADYNALVAVLPVEWTGRALSASTGNHESTAVVLPNPLCSVKLQDGWAQRDSQKEWVVPLLERHPVYAERLATRLLRHLPTAERETYYWAQRSSNIQDIAQRANRSAVAVATELATLERSELVAVARLSPAAARLQRFHAGLDGTPTCADDDLATVWRNAVECHADRPFLVDGGDGSRFTYRDADAVVSALMHRLRAEHVGPGDHVLLSAPVHVESILFFWAAVQVGAVVAVVDHLSPRSLVEDALAQVRPSLVLTDAARMDAFASLGVDRLLLLDSVESEAQSRFPSLSQWLQLEDHSAGIQTPEKNQALQPCLVLFTSGSTGRPKGVVLSQQALSHSGRLMARTYRWSSEDLYLGAGELHTMSGLRNIAVATVHAGAAAMVLPEEARQQATQLIDSIQRFRPTLLGLVPASLRQLAFLAERGSPRDWRSVRLILCTGSALPGATRRVFVERYGVPIRNYYGLTETAGLCIAEDLDAPGEGVLGHPIDALIRIVDEEGRDVPAGTSGEMLIYSANLMSGYLNDPQATAKAFRDGWFRTGDLAQVRGDGTVELSGRLREIVKGVHGEVVAPQEIEELLISLPFVADVAASGFDDGDGVERLLVAIVLRSNAGEEALALVHSALLAGLGQRHLPSRLVVCNHIPRSPHGKLLRTELLQLAQAHE